MSAVMEDVGWKLGIVSTHTGFTATTSTETRISAHVTRKGYIERLTVDVGHVWHERAARQSGEKHVDDTNPVQPWPTCGMKIKRRSHTLP